MSTNITTELVVLGSGPGGYSAAFRAGRLGKKSYFDRKIFKVRWGVS